MRFRARLLRLPRTSVTDRHLVPRKPIGDVPIGFPRQPNSPVPNGLSAQWHRSQRVFGFPRQPNGPVPNGFGMNIDHGIKAVF